MNDPSNGVPPALLPHIHLLSNFKFPIQAQMSMDTIVDYLMQAPNITQHSAPMSWGFLDAPANGSVLLVWQPGQLGQTFASDGYVWGDPEQAFALNAKDCHIEMFMHRVGYQYPVEQVATHCRRRYRVTGSKNPNVQIDPSLWLVHYTQNEPGHQVPANRIPLSPPIQQMLNTRRYLQSAGQLVRKEFMLHDRQNWPTINLPGGHMPAPYGHQGPMYPSNAHPPGGRGAPQGQYYPPQQQPPPPQHMPHPGPGPSPKRQRQTPPSHMVGGANAIAANSAAAGHEMSIEEEEDTSRGDSLDHLTPREISMMRYRQHHEWMEEILSSPYTIGQIVPVELGLGLKGELEPFTREFFDTQSESKDGSSARVGKMDPTKAEEFRKRAAQKLSEMNSDIDRMKKRQAKRMSKLKKGSTVKDAERRLRNAVSDPTSVGNELWRLEGLDAPDEEVNDPEVGTVERKPREAVDDIMQEMEREVNKKVEATPSLVCVHRGGLEEKAPSVAHEDIVPEVPEVANGTPGDQAALENGGYQDTTLGNGGYQDTSALENGGYQDTSTLENEGYQDTSTLENDGYQDTSTAMLDDMGMQSRSPSQQHHESGQPSPFASQMLSAHATPGETHQGEPHQASPPGYSAPSLAQPGSPHQTPSAPEPHPSAMDLDTEMTVAGDPVPAATPEQEQAEDWVMVNKDAADESAQDRGASQPPQPEMPVPTNPDEQAASLSAAGATPGAAAQINTPGSAGASIGADIPGLTPSALANEPEVPAPGGETSMDTPQFGDFGVDMDTAGDALAGYGPGTEDGGEHDDGGAGDLGLEGLDDSAFGDAFHGTEFNAGDLEGEGEEEGQREGAGGNGESAGAGAGLGGE